jgi:hypothetical protein
VISKCKETKIKKMISLKGPNFYFEFQIFFITSTLEKGGIVITHKC